MVTKGDYLQNSIKSLRNNIKDNQGSNATGSTGNSFAEQTDGVFGGLKRVAESFLHTHTKLQDVPEGIKKQARQQREEILAANRKRGSKLTQTACRSLAVEAQG